MNNDEHSGLNTPPFGHVAHGGPLDQRDRAAGHPDPGSGFNTGPDVGPGFVPPGGHPFPHQHSDHQPTQVFPAGPDESRARATSPVAVLERPRRRMGSLIAAVTLSALVGAGTGIGSFAYATHSDSVQVPIRVTTAPAAKTAVLNGTISAAAAKIEPSVVTITVQGAQAEDIGTGIVLDTAGHILTNWHVVEAAAKNGKITVTLHDGQTATAALIGSSSTNDLAVIKVDGVKNLVPVVFAKSSSVVVGQSVVAAGAPLGLSETITSGIVSNTARPVRSGVDGNAVYLAVQTDTAINPGNSGGPLVDLNGSVLGINSSIASTGSGQGQGSQSGSIGIGFAIPADVASRVAGDIIAHGTSPDAVMGVSVAGSDSTDPTATGVALQSVTKGSAADKAGLRAGDVITKVNDFDTTSADGLIAATRFYAPGSTVTVTYQRSGATDTTRVTLGSR
ncbi:trypsin-like peptidase domain-containing protein [Microlunatus panaciterrae]|uniref:Serine protease PepD n=1 Tax=Microlunatus panaciterrae TaxID=400768 RepID=A0ABS2RJK7_9ACTN|nr:trypsin-like peptidase domain-containing protein [Microlunatus panaciterrae]MBM7799199.1 putative serine protease PepD [Microlunatus panaciterrae]